MKNFFKSKITVLFAFTNKKNKNITVYIVKNKKKLLIYKVNLIWRHLSISGLTPHEIKLYLTHLGLKTSI